MDPRLAALVTLVGSLVLAGILAVVVRSLAARVSRRDGSETRQRGVGRSTFAAVATLGVVVALSVLDEEALDGVPEQALAFVPRLLGAGVLLFGGWLLANLVARLIDQSVQQGTGRDLPWVPRTAKWLVLGAAIILALGQLGIETTFLVIAVAVALGSLGLSAALLVSRAGGDLARQAAHGRYLRRHLAVGDHVETDDWSGVVVRVDAATVVLDDGSGTETWVPNASVVERPVRVTRRGRPTA